MTYIESDKPERFRDRSVGPVPLWGVILIAVGSVFGLASLIAPDETDEPDAADLEYAAFDVCKQYVSDQLRAPGTAVFRDFFEDDGEVVVTGTGAPTFVVRSSVDSENGFGALLRTEFVCEVGQVADGTWRLANLATD